MSRKKATPQQIQAYLDSQVFKPTEIEPSARSKGERGKTRIMYVELKSAEGHNDNGPAYIGRVTFSKTGRTIYYRDLKLQSLKGTGICANYFDVATGDEYWVSGCKKNGQDRHWAGGGSVIIDDNVREEYWTKIRNKPQKIKEKFA